ncbi:glycosyltransferase [Flammeovirga sp. SJP92]|nr:glycosyltransferase [Flammeovirga sp. SJP92]
MASPRLQADFDRLKCCVLIPTYNNDRELKGVIDSVLEYTTNVIVINDGCTDTTSEILSQLPNIQSITFEQNRGKGKALRAGFLEAEKQGFEYAITIDSDGQHKASDLPQFIEKLETSPNAIIIGARDMLQNSVPGKSSFGHKFSNFWFTFETGIKAPDTQSGYRLYPLKQVNDIQLISWRYEFEIEILVRSAWKGVAIETVPINVYYPPTEERITHFRPFTDFTRISILNTILVTICLLYIKPRDFFRSLKKKNIKEHIKDLFFDVEEPPYKKALAVFFGVFMGIVPIWGYQLVTAIGLAHFFKLNKPIVIVAANISIPPFIPLWLYASFKTGEILFNEKIIIPQLDEINFDVIQQHLMLYSVGATVFAFLLAFVLGCISFGAFKLIAYKAGEE